MTPPEDDSSSESDTSGEISEVSDEPIDLCLKYEDVSSDDLDGTVGPAEPPTPGPTTPKTQITQVCVGCHRPMDTTQVEGQLEVRRPELSS